MLTVETETPGLHSVSNVTVQHSDPADLGVVGDADTTDGVVRTGGDLPGTPGAVPVRVYQVVPRCGVRVVVIDVGAGLRVVVGHQIGVTFLHTVVQNSHHNVLASDAELPSLLDIHVQHATSVDVPHERVSGVVEVHSVIKRSVGVDGGGLLLRHSPGLLLLIKAVQTSKLVGVIASKPPLSPPPVLDDLLFRHVDMVVVLQTLVSLHVFLDGSSLHVVALEEVVVLS